MWDTVRAHFEDGTSTVIHVHEDASISDALADLEDETGLDVVRYTILGTVDETEID